jgi:hypothetical protein
VNSALATRTISDHQSVLVDWQPASKIYQSSHRVFFDADTALKMVANVVMKNGYAAIAIDSFSFTASRFIDRETGCLQIDIRVVAITPIVSEIRVSFANGNSDKFANFHGVRRLKQLAKRIADSTQYMPSWI